MKAQTATWLASGISATVLFVSLVAIANIYAAVQDIWAEFDGEMASFKVHTVIYRNPV